MYSENQRKTMAEKIKENKMMQEFGKWLMDVSKYVLTAVLISTLFSDVKETPWLLVVGGFIVVSTLLWGMILIKKNSGGTTKKRK